MRENAELFELIEIPQRLFKVPVQRGEGFLFGAFFEPVRFEGPLVFGFLDLATTT